MRFVLDTNVFISGAFFSGPPSRILEAWADGRHNLLMSPEIFTEYERVGKELQKQFADIDLAPFLSLVTFKGSFVEPAPLPIRVCDDPDDDKFFACALAGGCRVIVSGDKHLMKAAGYRSIAVLRPRQFAEQYLA